MGTVVRRGRIARRGRLALIVAAIGVLSLVMPFWRAAATVRAALVGEVISVPLAERNRSAVTGVATLVATGEALTEVVVIMDDGATYPTHVHTGSCANLDPMPAFPLADAPAGEPSSTIVDLPIEELLTGGYAIAAHRPSADLASLLDPDSVVACGDIARSAPPDEQGAMPGGEGTIVPPVAGVGLPALPRRDGLLVALAGLSLALVAAAMALRLVPFRPAPAPHRERVDRR